MIGIVDRIEGHYAVVELEDKKITNIKICKLPKGIKEGDVIDIGESITVDAAETQSRKNNITIGTESIWK